MQPASAPPTDSAPRTSLVSSIRAKPTAILLTVVTAAATITAAIIGKPESPDQPSPVVKNPPGIQVCVHENGMMVPDSLKVVGPDGYKKSFENGELDLPQFREKSRFAIYAGDGPRKLLGTFVWLGYQTNEVFMVHIEQKTEFWEPATRPLKNDSNGG